jgi:hypothetical protein
MNSIRRYYGCLSTVWSLLPLGEWDQCLHSAEADVRPPRRKSGFDPLPAPAIQSSCVAVFLFDQLVRAQQDRRRHIEAKRLGGLHIEHGLVFRSNFARSSAAISLAKA